MSGNAYRAGPWPGLTPRGAGLLLDPSDGPLVMAEAWATLLTDTEERERLITKGTERLRDFDPDEARHQVLQHLASVL